MVDCRVPSGYEPLRTLGTGRLSQVLLCRDESSDHEVALKILDLQVEEDLARRTLRAELLAVAAVARHVCAVRVTDVGFLDHQPYLVMEPCPGPSAQARLASAGPLPVDEVLVLATRLALALHASHRRGVLHLDVRPANVLADAQGEALLADHGLTRVVTRADPRLGALFDPLYAPRELFGWEPPGPACDVYGLGATMYTLLGGVPAHAEAAENGRAALYAKLLEGGVPRLGRGDLPEPLFTLIRRMTAPNSEDRPPLPEVHRVLRTLMPARLAYRIPVELELDEDSAESPGAGSDSQELTGPAWKRAWRRTMEWLNRRLGGQPGGRRRPAVALLATGAVLVVAVVGAVTVIGEDPPAVPVHSALLRQPVPPGWSTRAAWTAQLALHTKPAVSEDAATVAIRTVGRTADDTGRVQMLDTANGRARFTSAPLPARPVGHPSLTRVDGHEAVVVPATAGGEHKLNRLLVWPADGSRRDATAVDLPPGATLSYAGSSPLVCLSAGCAADGGVNLIQSGQAVPVTLPQGSTAMAADGSTVICAVTTGPWWQVSPGQPARQVNPVPPRAGVSLVRIAGAGHGLVAAVWTSPTPGQATAVIHEAATGRVIASATGGAAELRVTGWVRAAGDGAAALGPVVFDLDRRTGRYHRGWAPVYAAGGTFYGGAGGKMLAVAAGDGRTTDLAPGTLLPWGIVRGQALVLDEDSAGTTLFALLPL